MPELYHANKPNSPSSSHSDKADKSALPNVTTSQQTDSKPHVKSAKTKPNFRQMLECETKTKNPMSAFMVFPKHIKVEIQDEQEEILLLLRRHIFTNVKWLCIALLMIVSPILLQYVPLITPLPLRFQLMTYVLWYLIVVGYIVESFLSWYFNVYIITDERVIDIDFLNLLYKNIGAAKIENIEEISTKTTGAIRSVFNFGTVLIQTAGESPQIEFEDVPQPQKVSKFLNELLLEEEQEKIEGRVR